ncbi:MAG TPA: hypothetical protein VGG35_05560 [Streptosporangiaceae bacterium]
MTDAATARRMWTLIEPVHVVTYFGPEARQAFEAAGLRGFWRGYFAGRAAPLGAVDAPVIIAAFCSFAPSFVRRALPAVWELITPAEALRVREAGAVAAIRAVLGADTAAGAATGARPEVQAGSGGAAGAAGPALAAAADLLAEAARDLDPTGRPLAAPNAALPVPAEPAARLWHAATVLREHRGDGHVAALVAAGVDGCEALVLRTAVDQAAVAGGPDSGQAASAGGPAVGRAQFQAVRGWADPDWDAAAGRLRDRGWLDNDLAATAAGLAVHQAVEAATDLAAARPWARLGPERTAGLAAALTPVARACTLLLPFPNPVGVPRAAGPTAAS